MKTTTLDINQICERIPHRYPIIMLDKAEIWNETHICSEFFLDEHMQVFQGHFPGNPVFPGVYVTEIMAQTAAVLLLNPEENRGKLPILSAISKMRYFSFALPGETLSVHAEIKYRNEDMYGIWSSVFSGERSVAMGELLMVLKQIPE